MNIIFPTSPITNECQFLAQKRLERELEKTKKSTLHSYTDNDDEGQDIEETHLKDNLKHKNKSR